MLERTGRRIKDKSYKPRLSKQFAALQASLASEKMDIPQAVIQVQPVIRQISHLKAGVVCKRTQFDEEYVKEYGKMLILTRRIGETLNIGDDVRVTVLGVKGNQVRIGVTAPRDIPVHREEIYDRIKKEEASNQAVSEED